MNKEKIRQIKRRRQSRDKGHLKVNAAAGQIQNFQEKIKSVQEHINKSRIYQTTKNRVTLGIFSNAKISSLVHAHKLKEQAKQHSTPPSTISSSHHQGENISQDFASVEDFYNHVFEVENPLDMYDDDDCRFDQVISKRLLFETERSLPDDDLLKLYFPSLFPSPANGPIDTPASVIQILTPKVASTSFDLHVCHKMSEPRLHLSSKYSDPSNKAIHRKQTTPSSSVTTSLHQDPIVVTKDKSVSHYFVSPKMGSPLVKRVHWDLNPAIPKKATSSTSNPSKRFVSMKIPDASMHVLPDTSKSVYKLPTKLTKESSQMNCSVDSSHLYWDTPPECDAISFFDKKSSKLSIPSTATYHQNAAALHEQFNKFIHESQINLTLK